MRRAPTTALLAALTAGVLAGPVPVPAFAGSPGGTQAPSMAQAGGSEYGVVVPVAPQRPVVGRLSVPRTATAGRMPRVSFRIEEAGVGTVAARVTVTDLALHRAVLSVTLGWVHTGRTVTVGWPAGTKLAPGTYQITVGAHDHHGGTLLRRAHSSGQASLTVTAPPPPVSPPPAPVPSPPPTEPGVPTPAETAAAGAVFPVAGAHNFGGPENRFGAPRGEHTHQGQDVLTAEGTPIVAPMAGTISWTSYQAGGAGYYAVEHTTGAFDFMFAHCQAGSLAVTAGQAVSAGQQLCLAGQTGDASAPHLHFEMWVGGWQASTGHPIDPLPYLEAWDHLGAEAK